MLKLFSILGNDQYLDGGAMFGHVPKAVWSKWMAPDDQNRIKLATRALLVQREHRGRSQNILLETGVGAFFEPKLKQRYGVTQNHHVLLDSLGAVGLEHSDIDIIILSHLHFDHAGGLLPAWQDGVGTKYELLFPNAKFITSRSAFERSKHPLLRDKASFIVEIARLLQESGRLELIEDEQNESDLLGDDFKFWHSNGHTPGMLCTEIKRGMDNASVIFAADLIPGKFWCQVSFSMGYDRCSEQLIKEKQEVLNYLAKNNGKLFFTHDPEHAAGTVNYDVTTEKYNVINLIKDVRS